VPTTINEDVADEQSGGTTVPLEANTYVDEETNSMHI
jgi:hypothetical protein